MSTEHKHKPYSYHGDKFRCQCGAQSYSGAGPWSASATRGCVVCAAPATERGEAPLCAWHRSITGGVED